LGRPGLVDQDMHELPSLIGAQTEGVVEIDDELLDLIAIKRLRLLAPGFAQARGLRFDEHGAERLGEERSLGEQLLVHQKLNRAQIFLYLEEGVMADGLAEGFLQAIDSGEEAFDITL